MLQNGLHTRPLVIGADRLRTRACGFAPDIEHVRALSQQLLTMATRCVRREMLTAIRKRIGRDIDNAHHPGLRQVNVEAGGLPKHGVWWSKKRGCEAPFD